MKVFLVKMQFLKNGNFFLGENTIKKRFFVEYLCFMKILNGNRYYEREDIAKYYKSACLSLIDPSVLSKKGKNFFSFPVDFLYSADSDELDQVKLGISKLNNTISWEFSSESALNLNIIEKSYQSLRVSASDKIDNQTFKTTNLENVTTELVSKYESWLSNIGNDILFSFFSYS